MGRTPCCDKSKVKRGSWSPEEDAALMNYLQNHGTGGNWISLPQRAGLKRCGKSCRLRWLNYLRPDIKHGCFTDEEDTIILSLYSSLGSRWSVIASKLAGRTDNDVKNRWNTKLKKKFMLQAAAAANNNNNNNNSLPSNNYHHYSTNTSLDHQVSIQFPALMPEIFEEEYKPEFCQNPPTVLTSSINEGLIMGIDSETTSSSVAAAAAACGGAIGMKSVGFCGMDFVGGHCYDFTGGFWGDIIDQEEGTGLE